MLDKIMDLVGSEAINKITNIAGINTTQAKQMLPLAEESLSEGLMSELSKGNMDGILGLFKSAGGSNLFTNSIFNSLKGLFMKKIMSKMGLPESVAGLAAGSGIESIIGSLAGKMKEDGDNEGIDISNLVSVLGIGGGAADMIGGLLGNSTKDEGSLLDSVMDTAEGLIGGNEKEKNSDSSLFANLKNVAGGLFGK